MKCKAKTKSVEYKKDIGKTSGGSYDQYTLEPIDDKIVKIIGDVPIFGQPNTFEPSVNFEGYEIVMGSTDSYIIL